MRARSSWPRPKRSCRSRAVTLPGTLVLETTYMTRSGWLTVTDALLVAPWGDATAGELPPYRRVPRDRRAAHVLLRTARCSHGSVELAFECDPVFDYGARRGTWSRDGDRTARVRHPDGGVELSLTGDLRLGIDGDRVRARTVLREGDEVFVALSWSGSRPPTDLAEAREGMATTATFWRDWLARGCFPDHPWRAHLQRSALVLKGLIYAPTGAMVAAATSSLPETLGGERNWDYRYTWIRDAAFTLWGLYTLGFDAEADDFLRFVAEVSGGEADRLHIMYGIDGERELPERTLDHLSGYAGSRPVRVGNGAYAQAQHDVWGILLDAIQLHTAGADHLPDWLWPIVERQVEQACTHWRDPDHGIWEVLRQAAALHGVEGAVLGGGRPRSAARPHPGMQTFPGDPGFAIERARALAAGDPANVTRLDMGAHSGTHVDAPVHFVEDAGGVETLPLDALEGPAMVIDARVPGGEIEATTLRDLDLPGSVERVLLVTGCATLTPDAAEELAGRRLRLVGVDRFSVGGPQTHRILFAAGVVVLEGLDLSAAPPLLGGSQAQQVRRDDVVVQREPHPGRAGAGELLAHHLVEPEVHGATAAELLRNVRAQQPRLPAREPQLPADHPARSHCA